MDLFIPAFVVGLVTSAHCVAMCGGLVLTYAVKGRSDGPWHRRIVPHAAYQGAKIASYVTVGVLLGSVGALLGLDETLGGLRGYFTVFASVLMVLIGLQMTGWFPVLDRLAFRPPRWLAAALSGTRRKARAEAESGSRSLATPVTFGLLTGLMPCAPLMAQQAAAAASGSPVSGAVVMLGFGLGTAPLMLGFGAVSGALSHRVRAAMNVVAALVIVGFGLVLLDRGLTLAGSSVTARSIARSVAGAPAAERPGEQAAGPDGVVEVPLAIENVRFVPAAVGIPADMPVRLVVERREDNACSDQIAIPQLGVIEDLVPFGTTVVELPPAKAGSYTLTCGMGMMSGSLVVGGATGAGGGSLPLAAAGSAAAVGAGWWVTRARRRVRAAAGTPSGPLGLTPAESALALAAVGGAIVAGLALGGMFD